MDSKHPPAQQLLPRPGPLQVPANHATSGRAGRCAAPWRPAPRRPRRPARYLAAGGRSRNERGASQWWWRGPFPRALSASHAQGWLVPRKASPSVTGQCSAVFLQQFLNAGVRRPRCPASSNQLETVLWILCSPFVPYVNPRANTIVGTPGKVSGICSA